MIRRIGILLIGTMAGFLVMYWPMGFLVKEQPAQVILLAALTCALPGVIVLVVSARLRDQSPELKMVAVLATTVFRMFAAIATGVVLYLAIAEVKEHVYPFVAWGIVFYIVTLLIETRLLYIDSSGSASHHPDRDGQSPRS